MKRKVKGFYFSGLLTSLVALSACGAPPRRLADEPSPAPRVPFVSRGSEGQPPVVAVVAFTTTIAPGTNLGGNFDDDGTFRMRESDNRMFIWGQAHECLLSDEVLSVLEQEAGFVALPSPDCWPGVGEPDSTATVLTGTLEDLTLNSFADPGRVDVEVMVVWELYDPAGARVFRKSTYGFTSLEIGEAILFGGTVRLAVGESLRRLLTDEEFGGALQSAR